MEQRICYYEWLQASEVGKIYRNLDGFTVYGHCRNLSPQLLGKKWFTECIPFWGSWNQPRVYISSVRRPRSPHSPESWTTSVRLNHIHPPRAFSREDHSPSHRKTGVTHVGITQGPIDCTLTCFQHSKHALRAPRAFLWQKQGNKRKTGGHLLVKSQYL